MYHARENFDGFEEHFKNIEKQAWLKLKNGTEFMQLTPNEVCKIFDELKYVRSQLDRKNSLLKSYTEMYTRHQHNSVESFIGACDSYNLFDSELPWESK